MMKVLIVGAGPAGLTTAVELARRGIVSDVIDLRESGSGLSRAVGITLRRYRQIGRRGNEVPASMYLSPFVSRSGFTT